MIYDLTENERALWAERTRPERLADEGGDVLKDPLWRIANLYQIQTETGEAVAFEPNPEQVLVIVCLYVRGWQKLVIPKARQLGISTLGAVVAADCLCFDEGSRFAWIDKNKDDAKGKKRKVDFAFGRLDESLKAVFVEKANNSEEMAIGTVDGSAPAEFAVGVSFRGGTVKRLWISEWGAIQNEQRNRSIEIQGGALPAVERAILSSSEAFVVVETTWKTSGLDGELGRIVKAATEEPENAKNRNSWRVLFFGWQGNPLYQQEHGMIDDAAEKYFASVEPLLDKPLTRRQKYWYAQKLRESSPRHMKSEYPTIASECWTVVPEGSFFGAYIEKAKSEGRYRVGMPINDGVPVLSFWDLGAPINVVGWMIQVVGWEWRVIDCDIDRDVTLVDRIASLRARHKLGRAFLPHDAGIDHSGAGTTEQAFNAAGLKDTMVVKKTQDIFVAIEQTISVFGRFVFVINDANKERMLLGLQRLAAYHSMRQNRNGGAVNAEVHDIASHAGSAFRQIGQAIAQGLIADNGSDVVASMEPSHGPRLALMGHGESVMAARRGSSVTRMD